MQVDPNSESERLRERLALLNATGRAIGQAGDLDELCRAVYDEISRAVDTTGFILGLYDEASQTVSVVYQVDTGVRLPSGAFPLGSGFTSQVIRTRSPRLIRHWSAEGPPVQIQYATGQRGLPESSITVPLLAGNEVVGVLSIQSYRADTYDEDDLLTLETLGRQIGLAIQNLRVSQRLDTQLQRRVSELETILESMDDALLIVDAQGRIVRLNRAARELLNAGDTSIVYGQPLDLEKWGQWSLGARAIAEALQPMVEALRRGEARRDVEVTIRHQGRRVWSFSCAPLYEGDGALSGGVIVFRDVTGRREIERLKDEVLSIASHDLKNPLTVIKGQIQLLRRRLANGETETDCFDSQLATIEQQCNRLVELTDSLLDFSRLEAGRFKLNPVPTDLVAIARHVIREAQTTTERHELLLSAPERIEGVWDERGIEQVLRNLVANAIKYSPEGGRVEVALDVGEREVTVCVRDEGIGLAAGELSRVFERFYRGEGTRRLEGSGLGLYICSQIVDGHGGRIWADSRGLGYGSSFCFTLPRESTNSSSDSSGDSLPDRHEG